MLLRRLRPAHILPLGAASLLGASALFAYVHGSLAAIAAVQAVFGFGVGAIFAVMPGFIVTSVPAHETGSALSFNQVLRYIGYGIGSSLSAVVLQAATIPGHALPAGSGYTTSGLVGCAVWAATAGIAVLLPRVLARRPAGEHLAGEHPAEEMEMESIAGALPREECLPGEAD